MASVLKTKDSGWGSCGGWRGRLLQRFASVAFCWVALLVKKKVGEKTDGKKKKREKHLTRHIEKKRALNAIKARGEIRH